MSCSVFLGGWVRALASDIFAAASVVSDPSSLPRRAAAAKVQRLMRLRACACQRLVDQAIPCVLLLPLGCLGDAGPFG